MDEVDKMQLQFFESYQAVQAARLEMDKEDPENVAQVRKLLATAKKDLSAYDEAMGRLEG